MNDLLGSIEEFLNEQNAAENSVRMALSELMDMERKRVAVVETTRRKSGRNRRRTGPEPAMSPPKDSESVQRALSDMLSMENQRREAQLLEDAKRAEEAKKRWLKEERKRAEDHAIVRSTFADLLPAYDTSARRSASLTGRNGAASLLSVHPGIGAKIAGIGGWERAFVDDEFDNLILVQCVHVESLLSFLLLGDGMDIFGEISTHLSEKQKEILRFFFSRQQRATLGLIQLWLVGLRRYLVDGSPAGRSDRLVNWISSRFGDVPVNGRRETPSALFCDKRLVAFIDSFRADYRNPLVHPENRADLTFDYDRYGKWCQTTWGAFRLNDWLEKGWSGNFGWVSALVESAANARRS